MTEATLVRTSSVKGAVRAEIAAYLQVKMAAGRLTAMIARSADSHGLHAENSSIPAILVFQKLAGSLRSTSAQGSSR
jgi:hypothetical protein